MKFKFFLVPLLLLVLLISAVIPMATPVAAEEYTIVGSSVIISTDKGEVTITPYTITASSWVEVKFKSKSFTGDVDISLGFTGIDGTEVTKSQSWQSYEHKLSRIVNAELDATFTPSKVISIKNANKSAVSTIGDRSLNTYISTVVFEQINPFTSEVISYTEIIAYNAYDIATGAFTYRYNGRIQEYYYETYPDWKDSSSSLSKESYSKDILNTWDTSKFDLSIAKDIEYISRFWLEVPFAGFGSPEGKYNVVIKPSTLALEEAFKSGNLIELDPWYSSSWLYRKSFTISRATGAVTNYQFPLKVYYGAGADGTEAVEGITAGKMYCNSLCQTDFDDIRVTNSDGETLMDYWVETVTASTSEVIWIEHDSIGTGATTFYVYYGNAGASSVSNGANTFNLFDDFSGTLATLWNITGTAANSSGICQITGANSAIDSKAQFGLGYSVKALSKTVATGNYGMPLEWRDQPEATYARFINHSGSSATYESVNDQVGFTVTTLAQSTNYYTREIRRLTSSSVQYYGNGSILATRTNNETAADRAGARANGKDVYVDWIFVRQCLAVEPAWGSWGDLEGVPTEASISNTPSTYDFGLVYPGIGYPTGLAYFNITNNSGAAVDITIAGANMTGGVGWVLSDTATLGTNQYGFLAGLDGGSYTINVTRTEPYSTLKSGLADAVSQLWGLLLLAPSEFTDGVEKSGNITLTASIP